MRPLQEAVDFSIGEISGDEPYQVRVGGTDEDYVDALAAACESNPSELPPIILRRYEGPQGPSHYIVDGHQRVAAYEQAGLKTIQAIVIQLSNDEEAADVAWQSNFKNAKNLTFQDRVAHARRLAERELPPPDAEIAQNCGISRTTAWRLSNDVYRKQPSISPVVRYLRRIAFDPADWKTPKVAAREIRRAIPRDQLDGFIERLGKSALAVLRVAEELGFSA